MVISSGGDGVRGRCVVIVMVREWWGSCDDSDDAVVRNCVVVMVVIGCYSAGDSSEEVPCVCV